jgi:putative toxin-antitoxin system antitoxin component (TIGR02293 family)
VPTKRKQDRRPHTGLAEEERPFVHDEIMRGIPARRVKALIDRGVLEAKLIHRLIPERTFNRRVANNEPLKPAEADGVARLMRLFELAKRIFRDDDFAREFLRLPNPALGNRIPNDLAETEAGARDVETILWRIAYGDYT